MSARTVQIPSHQRAASVRPSSSSDRTVEVVFATREYGDVLRMDYETRALYWERLSLDEGHMRLGRLNSGAPLLKVHNRWSLTDVAGTVVDGSVSVTPDRASVLVRFSKRDDVEPIYQDVLDGIIRNASVGCDIYTMEETTEVIDGYPVRLAVDWEPLEISLVPIGADAGAQVQLRAERSEGATHACVVRTAGGQMDEDNVPVVPPGVAPAQPPVTVDAEAVRAAERARIVGIQSASRAAGMPSMADDLVASGVSVDQARAKLFDAMAAKSDASAQPPTTASVRIVDDERARFQRGAIASILGRAGGDILRMVGEAAKRRGETFESDPGEYRGLTMVDLARAALRMNGESDRGMDRMTLVGRAFTSRAGSASVGDYPILLEVAAHKILQAAFALQPDTHTKWCAVGTVSDFRAHNRYELGSFGALDSLTESGEFKYKYVPDGAKASITAGTRGNIVPMTRQMIVNDDLGVLVGILSALGRASMLTVESAAYALLALNGGLGPTQTDTQPLFHTNRSNVGTTAALSAAALDADAALMSRQKDVSGNDYLDLQPAVLLLARELRGAALVINTSEFDPDTVANKAQQKPNSVRGMFREVVATPRLASGVTRRYLFADPSLSPVFEVAYLDGQREPVLETRNGWTVDGSEFRARLDFGVAAVGSRGAVTNAG